MESLPNWSAVPPVPRVGALRNIARVTQHGPAVNAISTAPRMARVWRETVATFVTHSGPVLLSAWVGFAATVAVTQGYRSLTGLTPLSLPWVFLLGAIVGLLLHALAQAALAWIGLRGDSSSSESSTASVLRAATASWQRILPGAVLQALLTFVCALSLTPLLISSGLVTIKLEPIDPNLGGVPGLAATRTLDAVALGVLHPVGEWMAPARTALLPFFLQTETPDVGAWVAFEMKNHMDPSRWHQAEAYVVPMATLPAGLIALAGLALMIAGEVLLRFNAAAAVSVVPHGVAAPAGVFAPLLESARLGVRYVRPVLLTALPLRLLARALQILCLILTTGVAETTVLPKLASSTGALWVAPMGNLACIASSVLVTALLTAFCDLYDARLYVVIARAFS